MDDHALTGHPRLRIFFDLSQSNCLAAANHQLSEIQPKQRQSPPTSTLMLRDAARSSYDLAVPGDAYSFMARNGFDVWTMDHDGYGHSGSSGNNSDIMSGVEDLKAATPVVLAETGRSKFLAAPAPVAS
jgi:hypothetical protein